MFSELLPVSESINQLVLFSGNAIPKPLLPRPCFLILVYFIQYNNTIQLSFDIALPLTGSSKVHLDASAAQMQLVGLLQGNNCVRRTCSRPYTVTVSDEVKTGTLHVTGALTDSLPCCHFIWIIEYLIQFVIMRSRTSNALLKLFL